MSSSSAIATITAIIAKMLETGVRLNDDGSTDTGLTDLDVTMLPPGKARPGNKTANQINIFLYNVLPNAAMRNRDLPRTVRPGETALPPLALNLQYLITAYGKGEDDRLAHRMMGRAMRILSDHPLVGVSTLFTPAEITGLLSGSGISMQPENVRITYLPLTLDELSKLWTMFQIDYRISTAYQVSVVLIDSLQPVRSTLPVLRRGKENTGASVSATRLPVLTGTEPAGSMPAVTLGSDLKVIGMHLDTEGLKVRFTSMRISAPVQETPAEVQDDAVRVRFRSLAEDAAAYTRWVPGFYTAAIVIEIPGQPLLISNEVPVALAPSVSISPHTAPAGTVTLTITCTPRVNDDQPVLLLFGDTQVAVKSRSTPPDPAQPSTFTFEIRNAPVGTHLIRLRVDGVDSMPFVVSGSPPLIDFDPNQKVTIT